MTASQESTPGKTARLTPLRAGGPPALPGKDIQFPKTLLFINALVPLALMLWDVYHKRVGANPLEFVTRTTGMLTLVFLMLTLAVTPVRTITRLNRLIKFRRMLGLFAFFYGCLHLLTYVWFDRYFNLRSVPGDIISRPFIAIGMTAFILMVPLAITSTNKMVKRLGGKRWSRLHKLIYGAGIAGVVHFWMLVKSDTRLPVTFGFVLLLLLAFRVLAKYSPPTPKGFTGSVVPPR
jgi:sulfoxide reductase heme-binding subunit YedZ